MAQESGVTGAPPLLLPHKVGFVRIASIDRGLWFLNLLFAYYKQNKRKNTIFLILTFMIFIFPLELIYSVLSISTVQQSDPVIYRYILFSHIISD